MVMLAEWEEGQLARQFGEQQARRRAARARFAVIALFGLSSLAAVLLLLSEHSWAGTIAVGQITINGRTEPAECSTEWTEPPVTTCLSESFVCRITDGDISCTTKR